MTVSNKNILIVGSNSIISNPLVEKLILNNKVTVAFSSNKCGVEINHTNYNTIELKNVLKQTINYDVVIIISSFIPSKNEKKNIELLYKINIELIELLSYKFYNSFVIFCSSVSVFTPKNNELISEKTNPNPLNEYAISKLWGEKIIQRNCKNYAIVRISSLIGVGMKTNSFIPIIIDKAITEKKITLFGNGNRLQNYITKDDVASIIYKIVTLNKNGLFLATGNRSYTNKEIATLIKYKTNCDIVFEGIDNSESFEYDNTFTKKELDITYEKSIEKSIEELIEWKRKQF